MQDRAVFMTEFQCVKVEKKCSIVAKCFFYGDKRFFSHATKLICAEDQWINNHFSIVCRKAKIYLAEYED
jgi:hypothetical protein